MKKLIIISLIISVIALIAVGYLWFSQNELVFGVYTQSRMLEMDDDLNLVAVNKDIIVGDGTTSSTIKSTNWADLRVPLESTRINPVTSRPVYTNFQGSTFAYLFAPTTLDAVHFTAQLPHAYKYGTNLHPHVHWAPDSTNTDDIVFVLECGLGEEDGIFTQTYFSTSTVAGGGTINQHTLTDFAEIDGSALDSLSPLINCTMKRDGADGADTFTGNVWGFEVDFHYQLDSLGSRTEDVK